MVIRRFPPVDSADEHGLLAVGGDLEPASLLLAYRSGVFPWPMDDETLTWFSPPTRAVIFLDSFHVPKSLTKALRKVKFEVRLDSDFRSVIERCAELTNRGRQNGTWITPEVIEAYCELFDHGYCHSFETYLNGDLVGGIYGVQLGRFFAAESSFFRVPNASKAAMCSLVEYLRSQEIDWFDCQVLTPFSEGFGAIELSRNEFMKLLATSF